MRAFGHHWPRAIARSIVVVCLLLGTHVGTVEASEGASSHYLPGLAGDILIAQPPQPGWLVANNVFMQFGKAGTAVLQGQVELDLKLDLVLDIPAATYTFKKPFLGGTYTVGLAIPFGHAKLDATLTGPAGGMFAVSDDSFHLSDVAITPLQLNWTSGKFSFKLAESIIAPTGGYDIDKAVNLGRNYWSFDTVGAVTWFNPASGTAMSLAAGIMVNTMNKATDYKTGTEFHLDFTINHFVSETVAIGIRGYYYKQLSGDSGDGAVLGPFKSEAFAIGPGIFWTPKSAGGRLVIAAKYMGDITATKRFKSHYGQFTLAWKL